MKPAEIAYIGDRPLQRGHQYQVVLLDGHGASGQGTSDIFS